MSFNDLLRQAVSIEIDKREGLDPNNFDPCIVIRLADGSEWYVSRLGSPTEIGYSNGSAAG